MRPTLRPGLQILRRDVHTLQLGLEWPGVAILRDSPAVRAVLAVLDGHRDASAVVAAATTDTTSGDEAAGALADLIACGAVVDQAATPRPAVAESRWAALWLLAGPERHPRELLGSRVQGAASVRGHGAVAEAAWAALVACDVPLAESATSADVVVIACDREPARSDADDSMRTSQAHVWATVRDLVGVVGPFVEPGASGCLRCADASRAEIEPAWPTLVAAATTRPLAVPACDPALARLVGSWAAHEVSIWSTGMRPQSWSRVIEIPHGFGLVETVAFDSHPQCGCGWARSRDTMGA